MGGGGRGGQSQPVWHLGHSQSLSCPSLILLGQGGNNAPIDAHTPGDNISVSPGTGAKQVSLVGVGSLLYNRRGRTSGTEQEVQGGRGFLWRPEHGDSGGHSRRDWGQTSGWGRELISQIGWSTSLL